MNSVAFTAGVHAALVVDSFRSQLLLDGRSSRDIAIPSFSTDMGIVLVGSGGVHAVVVVIFVRR